MRMPSARNWCSMASVASRSCSSTVSVISISSRVGCRPEVAERIDDDRHQARAAELRRRDVDGDMQMFRPLRRREAGLADHPFAERHDEADLFGERNEGRGRHHAALGMVPADQRLKAADLAALQVHHRLIVELELARGQRLAQVLLHDAAGLHLLVHVRLEEAERAAAVALGAVKREVRIAQQLVRGLAIARADRDADAGADAGLMAVDVVGLAHPFDDLLRQRGGIAGIDDRGLDDDEFVAAGPRDGVGLADEAAQAVGNDLQQLVAGGMAEGIVHRLELVEVEMMHRHHLLVLVVAHRLLQPLVEQRAVGEIGQAVVMRHVLDLDLGLALLGDVLMGGNPTLVGHRPMADLDGPPVHQFDDAVPWLHWKRLFPCASAHTPRATSPGNFPPHSADRRFR